MGTYDTPGRPAVRFRYPMNKVETVSQPSGDFYEAAEVIQLLLFCKIKSQHPMVALECVADVVLKILFVQAVKKLLAVENQNVVAGCAQ